MSSYTSLYRIANPKFYEVEKKKINEAQKLRHKNDPVYREKQNYMQNNNENDERLSLLVLKFYFCHFVL